jgi:hypothetical protein
MGSVVLSRASVSAAPVRRNPARFSVHASDVKDPYAPASNSRRAYDRVIIG